VNTATSAAAMSYGDDLRDLRDETSYGDDLHDEPASAEPGEPGGPAGFHPSGDADASFDAPRGRAARRRQLARWKKNKRRAAVATAVALVGGGLTLASMDRQSTDRAQAASAPDNRSMGAAGEETTGESTPDATPPGTHHSSHPTGPAHTQRQTAGSTAYRQSAHSVAAAPRTTVPNTHPDAAAAPVPAQTAAAPHRTTTPVSDGTSTGGTGTAAQPPASAPQPAPNGGTDTTGTSGTPQTSPSPAATSPSQLCLVVLCLG
jgi:hypothetical protein